MAITECPKCGADKNKLVYVQEATEYWTIDEIHEDGSVDLGEMAGVFVKDGFHIHCEGCGHNFQINTDSEN